MSKSDQPAGVAVDRGVGRPVPERADLERAVADGWLTHGWRPMHEAPEDAGALLLLVPTRWGKRSRLLQAQGDWFGSYWAIFNADEAIQRVDPVAWRPLHPCPDPKTPNVELTGKAGTPGLSG